MSIEPAPATLGGLLVILRTRTGLTQREVGDLLGVNDATVGHWEAGRRAPRELLSKLLEALGATDAEKLTAIALPRHVITPDGSDTSPFAANGPSPVITEKTAVPKLSARNEEDTAPTTSAPDEAPTMLSGVCLACSGRGQVGGEDCDACGCTGRVLLISSDEAVDAA